MSVIRLQSDRQEELVEAAELILTKWRNYSDERVSVRAIQKMAHRIIRLRQLPDAKGHYLNWI